MSDCKKSRSLFIEAFYEELDEKQRHFLEDHIRTCTKCKAEFAEMTSTLKIMNKRIRHEPDQTFWDDYENRLKKRIEKEELLHAKSESRWRTLVRILNSIPKWSYQSVSALLLVLIGIFIGRMMYSPSLETQQVRQMPSIVSQPEPGAELFNRTQSYIERSKLILLAIINFDPETEDPYALNLPHQQQVSRELVQEASFLKEELSDYDQRRLQNLIADLEVILLQIANLESENDFEALELVKKGVDSRGILLNIHITDIHQSIRKRSKTIPFKGTSNKI